MYDNNNDNDDLHDNNEWENDSDNSNGNNFIQAPMLMLILDNVNLLGCRLNDKDFWQDLAFLTWGSTMIRLQTIYDVCSPINVTLCI